MKRRRRDVGLAARVGRVWYTILEMDLPTPNGWLAEFPINRKRCGGVEVRGPRLTRQHVLRIDEDCGEQEDCMVLWSAWLYLYNTTSVPPTQASSIEQDARGGPFGELDEGCGDGDCSNSRLDRLEPARRLHAVVVVAECRRNGALCRALPDDAVVDCVQQASKASRQQASRMSACVTAIAHQPSSQRRGLPV
jgi:hypothetical protein